MNRSFVSVILPVKAIVRPVKTLKSFVPKYGCNQLVKVFNNDILQEHSQKTQVLV